MTKSFGLLECASLVLAVLLLLCFCHFPYGYFVFIRYATMAVGMAWAVRFFNEKKQSLAYVCAVVAVLFQPFFKIALGRTIWNVVDVIVAIALVAAVFIRNSQKEKYLKSASNLNGNLNCSKELEHYAS